MTDIRVLHGSFTTNVEVPAIVGEVFAAYGELPVRKRWFRMPGTPVREHKLDFSVGGGESLAATFAPTGGRSELLEYRSHFLDILPDERIVYTYAFDLDGQRRWASLVTIELLSNEVDTSLHHTEQYAYLAFTGTGHDDVAHLKGGTRLQLNGLVAALGSGR